MPISRIEMIEAFGQAADAGNAAAFVGAGLSLSAGMPTWEALLDEPRQDADVPANADLPLVAEYILQSDRWPRSRLETHILRLVAKPGAEPGELHESLAKLPVAEIWTTNYDRLIEISRPDAQVITQDDAVRTAAASRCTIIKMHGSVMDGIPAEWEAAPIITRTDFETYEQLHPRMWALLRAAYLSRTFLFLGVSFTDPNIEILHRLARTLRTSVSDRHMAVMTRPPDTKPDARRQHALRVRDLEDSGVKVHELNDHDELPGLLAAVVRRTRSRRLFVSGSSQAAEMELERFQAMCARVGASLADHVDWELSSLGGEAGWEVSRAVAHIRIEEGTYDARRIVLNYRQTNDPPPPLGERLATATYTNLTRDQLVPSLLDDCRAMLVVGGADRTAEEITWARQRGVGVVPLASTGGAAKRYWAEHEGDLPELGGRPVDPKQWQLLNSRRGDAAARAAAKLLRQAMYSS